jgi:hypothetical protein
MKKFAAVGVMATLLLPSLALATGNHPMAGCGLGYLLLSNQDNKKITQILGATTNGTFGTQTFGISSGTSGCTEDGAVKVARATEVYAEVNLDSLRREMAAGQGEYVNTFASMLGANEATRPQMVRFFQSEYQNLFPNAQTTSSEMLQSVAQKLSQHPELLG